MFNNFYGFPVKRCRREIVVWLRGGADAIPYRKKPTWEYGKTAHFVNVSVPDIKID